MAFQSLENKLKFEKELVKREVSRFASDDEVVLFSSSARGAQRAESDWNFLILLDQKELTKKKKSHFNPAMIPRRIKSNTH